MNYKVWKIYYGDGTTVSGIPPEDVPARNVQCIVVSDENHGWYLLRSNDYYWYVVEGNWSGGDIFGLWDYLCEPGFKKVLFGRTVTNREYDAALQAAIKDPDLPRKTGWQPNERRADL